MSRRGASIGITFLAVIAAGFITARFCSQFRRIDGQSAADWLTLASRKSRAVDYHAFGHSLVKNATVRFVLDQSADGRYQMQTTDDRGKCCELGFDGKRLWCTADGKSTSILTGNEPVVPISASSRIMGAGVVAGRQVVRIQTRSGATRKVVAIDRETGVMLALTTEYQGRVIGSMEIDGIDYRPVRTKGCRDTSAGTTRPASDHEIITVLGEMIRPRWLPTAMKETGSFLGPCACCGKPMASLQFSDGVSSLTLFEMSAKDSCMRENGCWLAETEGDLLVSKSIGPISITAVGNLDSRAMQRFVDRLSLSVVAR